MLMITSKEFDEQIRPTFSWMEWDYDDNVDAINIGNHQSDLSSLLNEDDEEVSTQDESHS